MKLPPPEEWLTVKQVARMYSISTDRLYRAYNEGRLNTSGRVVKLEMFKTFNGLSTTKKMIEDFLMRLNG